MIGNVLKSVFGTKQKRLIKSLAPLVAKINSLEESLQSLTDEQLIAKTDEFRGRLEQGETVDDPAAGSVRSGEECLSPDGR